LISAVTELRGEVERAQQQLLRLNRIVNIISAGGEKGSK